MHISGESLLVILLVGLVRLGIHIASGIVSSIIVATIGAVILLAIVRLATGAYPRRRWWRL
jgi:uncharacterized membrane protein YeaQ/YmgE (transglycosylase-associated protein family)